MYGFAEAGKERVFFHLEAFAAGNWPSIDLSPPPILGEEVLVDYDLGGVRAEDKAPRARRVERLGSPIAVKGVVESFNPDNGWGFALGDDGTSYYLHRSEVEEGRLPLPGQAVQFYQGMKRGRPRACYVRVGRLGG
jgi:cold shock CspA family protein